MFSVVAVAASRVRVRNHGRKAQARVIKKIDRSRDPNLEVDLSRGRNLVYGFGTDEYRFVEDSGVFYIYIVP